MFFGKIDYVENLCKDGEYAKAMQFWFYAYDTEKIARKSTQEYADIFNMNIEECEAMLREFRDGIQEEIDNSFGKINHHRRKSNEYSL